jgi:phosphomannomutase
LEPLIISVSGLRGLIGSALTAGVAARYAAAFGRYLLESQSKPSVCIGRDGRPSGPALADAAAGGLAALGVDVTDLGIATTPGVGIMVRHLGCSGGMVVTASHNPSSYNGLKLLLSGGMAPPADVAAKIRESFYKAAEGDITGGHSEPAGSSAVSNETDQVHIGKVLGIVDAARIAAGKFKVVLDSVNGAGGPVTKKLLGRLGCEVHAINDAPTGQFTHGPEPLAENLRDLCEQVKSHGADIGFAQDPDADRLAVVDENGRYIGEEYTLALAAGHVFGKIKGSAATNLSTSRMIDDAAAAAGCTVIRTPVGEANVAAAMIEHGCVIGGEGNGGVIDLRVGPIRDSLVAAALLLELMAETGRPVSALAGELGRYCMVKEKFAADPQQAERILDLASRAFAGARVNTADGRRFDFEEGWVHLRTSNTEPVMRVIAEAADAETARKYIETVERIRRQTTP